MSTYIHKSLRDAFRFGVVVGVGTTLTLAAIVLLVVEILN